MLDKIANMMAKAKAIKRLNDENVMLEMKINKRRDYEKLKRAKIRAEQFDEQYKRYLELLVKETELNFLIDVGLPLEEYDDWKMSGLSPEAYKQTHRGNIALKKFGV